MLWPAVLLPHDVVGVKTIYSAQAVDLWPRAIIGNLNHCTRCGAALEGHHQFCWKCGAATKDANKNVNKNAEPRKPKSPSPAGAGAVARAAAPASAGTVPEQVMLVAVVSAISTVMWLVLLTQIAAFILNPHGRADLNHSLAQAGVNEASRPGLLVVYEVILVLFAVVPAALHAVAFYGLTSLRRAGWIVAFLLAMAWSVILIGIPFLYLLWKRDNRQAYGIP